MTTHQTWMLVAGHGLRTWRERAMSVALFGVWIGAVVSVTRAAISGRTLPFVVTGRDERSAPGANARILAWPLVASAALVGAGLAGVMRLVIGGAEDGTGLLVHVGGAGYLLANLAVLIPAAGYRSTLEENRALTAEATSR